MERIGFGLFFFGLLVTMTAWAASKGYILSKTEVAPWMVLVAFWLIVTGTVVEMYPHMRQRATMRLGWALIYVGICSCLVVLFTIAYHMSGPYQWALLVSGVVAAAIGGTLTFTGLLTTLRH